MKKSYVAMALYVAFLLCVGLVYSAYLISSNVAYVNVSYSLSLTASASGSTVTLTAHLLKAGVPVSGATVNFYPSNISGLHSGSNDTAISSVLTNGSGDAVASYTAGGNGGYYFVATYMVA